MPIVKHYRHPFSGGAPLVLKTHNIGEWLLETFGAVPKVTVQVFCGEPSIETEITHDIAALMESSDPVYTVLESPGGSVGKGLISVALPFWGGSYLGAKAAINAFAPTVPNVGSLQNNRGRSPNNELAQRSNQVRILQRIEDIYGTVRSIPSLIAPSYTKYINNIQYEYAYLCVGRGYYDISDVRNEETLLADIDGARAAVYDPFTSPNSGDAPVLTIGGVIEDEILTVRRSNEIDGVTLYPLNLIQLMDTDVYSYIPDASGDIIGQTNKRPGVQSIFAPGDTITVTMTPSGGNDYSGTYTVSEVISDTEIRLTTSAWPASIIDHPSTVLKDGVSEWTSWVNLTGSDRTQVWANLVAVGGMYKDGGEGKIPTSVEVEIQIEKLNPDLTPSGVVETVYETLSGATSDERATTIEHVTSFIGPCRVRARRTTQHDYDFGGTIVDEVKLKDLYGVSPVNQLHFGNITTIQAVIKATQRALAAKELQLNCLASRKLPTYNGSAFSGVLNPDGSLASGTISATSRFVDIVAAVSIDPVIGNRNLSTDVDINQIYSTYQAIAAWAPEYAEFNYTLDSDNLSYEDTINLIANSVFCIAYRQNGKIRFSFDRAQTSAVVPTFCHRNKKPNSETITRNFAADADYDGIELVYTDPDTERNETIRLPLDGSAAKYKKVEIPGIRYFSQAWIRANREYERLRSQRVVIETVATTDARALLPNSRIDIVDDTRIKRFGGEVLAQDGLTLTLSQPVEFTPGEPHSILLKRRDGTSQGITVTPGLSPYKVVLQHLPLEEIVTTPDPDEGIRTIYSFASDSQRQKQAWLVQEIIPQDKQYVQIRAINYSDAYYQHDNEPVPNKDTVIY